MPNTTKFSQRDWMGYQKNALELLQQITVFWHASGYPKFRGRLEKRTHLTGEGIIKIDFDIRSNMVNGIPPR